MPSHLRAALALPLALAALACAHPKDTTTNPPPQSDDADTHVPAPASTTPTTAALDPAVVERAAVNDRTWTLLGGNPEATMFAVVGRRGALRWTEDGPPVIAQTGDPAFERLGVVEQTDTRVRVLMRPSGGFAHLLVWLDKADLAPQLAAKTPLRTDATLRTSPDDGAIELANDMPVRVLGREGDAVQVRSDDDRFSGWVAASELVPTFSPVAFEYPAIDAQIEGALAIAQRPGGKVMFRLPTEASPHDVRVVRVRKGWTEVELVERCVPGVRVHGWVRAKQVEQIGPMGTGWGCGHGQGSVVPRWGELESAPAVKLTADTALSTLDGQRVGRVVGTLEARRGGDGELRIHTPWGLLPIRAEGPANPPPTATAATSATPSAAR